MTYATLLVSLAVGGANAVEYAGYIPGGTASVQAHAMIDLDQQSIMVDLAKDPTDYTAATDVYTNGKNSVKGSGAFRTIKGFSKDLAGEPTWDKFFNYFGDATYANMWVSGALAGTKVDFTNGNGDADFSAISDDATRVQAAKKATAYSNVWIYSTHELFQAESKCSTTSTDNNDAAQHYWDEGWVFYTGSLAKSADDSGVLMYSLATSRGKDFGTGQAVNTYVLDQFNAGKAALANKECSKIRGISTNIINRGFVPIVQGLLKYTCYMDKTCKNDFSLKAAAEASVFAFALMGQLNHCSPAAAAIVYKNVKIGSTSADFSAVKKALEDNYMCMGISCADVGAYSPYMTQCTDPSSDNPCFAKDTTTACKLLDAAATPKSAYAACYDKAEGGAAARVLMATLAAGDTVLTATTGGALAKTTVVVNHHASADHTAKMLTLQTADGATLSVTPDHAIFVDGALAAASEAKVGATLTRADGTAVKITRVAEADAAAVITPVTTSGTILASDVGAPVLAASHLMIFAPLYKYAASRAVANAALYVVGDVTNWIEFGAILLAKLGATLAVAAVAAKTLAAAK